jgi:pimeloyl-ACP methyl ester carboxylesterase
MATTNSEVLIGDGVQLHYRLKGEGPLLILLAGGAGDADGFDAMADHLVDLFTVLTYDRRGLSRSVIEAPIESLPLENHCDDVHRLLKHLTNEPVLVFGTSIGAVIGLDLVARHPEQVRCLIAHEPPSPELLKDPERTQAVQDELDIEEAYRCDGVPAAMKKFVEVAHINFEDREPDAKLPQPTPQRALNLQFFLSYDAPAVRQHRLAFPSLIAQSDKIIPAAGETSTGAWQRHCAQALATLLGREIMTLPGGHAGFASHPRGYAARLRSAFANSQSRR